MGRSFDLKTAGWLERNKSRSDEADLRTTVTQLVADTYLRDQLAHRTDEHSMSTVIKRCIDLDLPLGTRDLRVFHQALKDAHLPCDRVILPLESFLRLSAGLQYPEVVDLLESKRYKALPPEERFIELVLRLEAHNLLGKSTHLGHIYSGLPAEIKRELKKIDLPLPELKGIHQALRHPQMIEWIQNNLRAHPPEERLEVLRDTLKERGVTVSRQKLYGALPHQLAEGVYKSDISTACVRLDLEDQTVFFDSGEERIVAQLLYRYGLIKKFTPGENLHIRVDESRASLDFKIGPVFLEYHPLSHRDRAAGLTEEAASDQKRARLDTARFRDHRVVVISRLKDLYTLLRTDPDITSLLRPEYRALTPSGFTGHLKAAKAYGHAIDRAVRAAREAEPAGGEPLPQIQPHQVASIG